MGITSTGKVVASNDPLVNASGELNAGNKKDLMLGIRALHQQVNAGMLVTEDPTVKAARDNKFREAFANHDVAAIRIIGQQMADTIYETMGREGFGRKVLTLTPRENGQIARFRIRRKDVQAVAASNDPMVPEVIVRQDWAYPDDFYLLAEILIEDKELRQNTGDIMEEKYQDGLEATMTREDRILRGLMIEASSLVNDILYFGTLTPTVFSNMRTQIRSYGNVAVNCVLAFDLWDDIIADTEFSTWFDPVTKYNLILEGNLGSLMGVNLITDGYRHQNLRVLSPGEIFFTAAPEAVGGIQELQPVRAVEINQYAQGKPYTGWLFEGIEAMAVVNAAGVVYGSCIL
jgi:hypothetical protein